VLKEMREEGAVPRTLIAVRSSRLNRSCRTNSMFGENTLWDRAKRNLPPGLVSVHLSMSPAEFCSDEMAAKASAMRGGAFGRAYIRFI